MDSLYFSLCAFWPLLSMDLSSDCILHIICLCLSHKLFIYSFFFPSTISCTWTEFYHCIYLLMCITFSIGYTIAILTIWNYIFLTMKKFIFFRIAENVIFSMQSHKLRKFGKSLQIYIFRPKTWANKKKISNSLFKCYYKNKC